MIKRSLLALVVMSGSLCAHKEDVREIAEHIANSEPEKVEARLKKLYRYNLSYDDHKDLLKEFLADAQAIRKAHETAPHIGNSWVDAGTTLLGGLLSLEGFKRTIGYSYIGIDRLTGIPLLSAGISLGYVGYHCWYQKRCLEAAEQVEQHIEDALVELKKG